MVFRRPLQTSNDDDLAFETDRFIPLSFIVWDGFADEADGRLGITTWSTVFLQSPIPVVQYAWIPGVMVIVVVVELLIVWIVRLVARRGEGGA